MIDLPSVVGIERKTQSALFLDWNENILVQQVRCAFNVCHSESARHCGSMGFKSQRSAIFIHECCRNSTKSSCVSSPQLSHVFCVTIVKWLGQVRTKRHTVGELNWDWQRFYFKQSNQTHTIFCDTVCNARVTQNEKNKHCVWFISSPKV